MMTESSPAELRQQWAKNHEWSFQLEGDKIVMNATEKGNHFHNDIPLDQIDPYESEERFFYLRWPLRAVKGSVLAALLLVYGFGISWWVLDRPVWWWFLPSGIALAVAGLALAYHLKHHRMLLRFYHRMSGMELFAIFAELPDKEAAGHFLEALKREIPPWSYTLAGPSKTEGMARELKALHQLRKENVLTVDEFQFKKRQLLTEYFGHGRKP
jgi:hypothetical protein